MLHDICVGKTGTLTKGELSVRKYQIGDQISTHDNDRINDNPHNFRYRLQILPEFKQLINECIYSNSDVRIESNDDEKSFMYEPKGQALEVGLVQFLLDNEEDVPQIFNDRNRLTPKLCQLPFDQELKRKIVVRRKQGDAAFVRIYVKGAPEYVIPICK